MTYHDNTYLELVKAGLQGVRKPNRTGIDTLSVFGYQMKFNLRDGTIPMLTTKKIHTRSIIIELLWYLRGDGNIKFLQENGVRIWNEWADKNGDLGPVYGVMWRNWPQYEYWEHPNPQTMSSDETLYGWFPQDEIDQIQNLVDTLKNNPNDRRMLVTAWNPAVLPDTKKSFEENVANGKQALPPCHYTFQCFARPLTRDERVRIGCAKYGHDFTAENDWEDDNNIPKHELSLMLNQRSCDIGLGVPFNIVQYSILLRMLCEVSNMVPGDFIWNGGDVHVYENHIDQLNLQLTREPMPSPTFKFARKIGNIDDFKYEDFVIENYVSHPTIKMDVAV